MINVKLDPCRYCGGEAEIAEAYYTAEDERVVIKCRRCGITLDHTQTWWMVGEQNVLGNIIYKRALKQNLSAVEIWNGGMLDGKNG